MSPTAEEVEVARAKVETESIGPHASSLLIVPHHSADALAFFEVDWDADLGNIRALAELGEEIDSFSQWTLFRNDDNYALVLTLEWPTFGIERSLYFNVADWSVELDAVAKSGIIFLHSSDVQGEEKLSGALGVEVEDDLLTVALERFEK